MAAPYSTVGGYPGTPVNADGSPIVDTEDGVVTLGPSYPAGGLGTALTQAVIPPQTISGSTGIPPMNAMIIELRILCALINETCGNPYNLQQMRADELNNTMLTTGVL